MILTQAPPQEHLSKQVAKHVRKLIHALNGRPPEGLHHLVIQIVEQSLIETVLEYTEGNQSAAARMLGISRTSLRQKISTK